MKKPYYQFFLYVFIAVVSIALHSCSNGDQKNDAIQKDSSATPEIVKLDTQKTRLGVLAANKQVLQILRDKTYEQLPSLIHPVKGVRFSQVSYVDTASDQGFSPARLQNYLTTKRNQKLVWGTEMEGDSIRLTLPEYLAKEVYLKDFYKADSVGYNIIFRTGSTPESMEMVYGHAPFVSNYFAGDDKKYGGLDWRSLRLVFEKYEDKYYLEGVITDEWTP